MTDKMKNVFQENRKFEYNFEKMMTNLAVKQFIPRIHPNIYTITE